MFARWKDVGEDIAFWDIELRPGRCIGHVAVLLLSAVSLGRWQVGELEGVDGEGKKRSNYKSASPPVDTFFEDLSILQLISLLKHLADLSAYTMLAQCLHFVERTVEGRTPRTPTAEVD